MGFRVDTGEDANEKDFIRVSKEPGGRLAYLRRFPTALLWIDKPSLLEQMVAIGMINEHGHNRQNFRLSVMNFVKLDDEIVLNVISASNQDIPNLEWYSDKIICKAIERNSGRFKSLSSPSEKVMMTYANQRWIDMALLIKRNPSEKVLMRAIISNAANIAYIPNPSFALMEKAVRKNGDCLQHIQNPPEEIVRIAVSKSGMAIAHVKNPSEELQRLAVSRSANAITVIDNPIPELQIAAVDKSPNVIRLIKNPDEDAMWKALQQKPKLISSIKNATPEMESFAQIVS